jgi:PAS domain S-box-containing protein
LSLVSGLLMVALAVYVWLRRKSAPGSYILFATLAAIAHICLTAALEERCTTLAGHFFWLHVQIPAYACITVLWLLLVLNYVDRPISSRRVATLFVIPAATVLMHWTNDWGHLYWSRVWVDHSGHAPIMGRTYGLGTWFFTAFNYVMVLSGLFLLVRFLTANPRQRRRTLLLIGAMLLPFAANTLYYYDLLPVRYLDITPYAFSVTGIGMFWVIFRYRFQGIVPIAARSVVASMSDGIVVVDLDGRVADLNPAAEVLLGKRKEQVEGLFAETAFPDSSELIPYEIGQGPLSGDVVVHAGKGNRLCAAKAVDVVRGHHRIGRVITLRDVEAERQASAQLRQAQRAAEAAAVAKSRFLANMSHEIRTPMHAVVGANELLLDCDLRAEERDLVETAQEAAYGLLSILNDILDFSKIDAGRLELETIPFDLPLLMDQTAQLLKPTAVKKNLDLKLDISPKVPQAVRGDPTRLRQIVLNLAGNALKFTASGSVSIRVDGRVTAPNQALITIAVADTGIGIAPDRIGTLFREFTQEDSTVTRRFGGTGLGLAISQRLVEKMGGRIRVESTLGQGSTFTVEAPIGLANPVEITPPTHMGLSESETFPGCRVLLTEDNQINQKIGRRILERLGCEVEVANNGREAIALAESAKYDLILMDLHMPEVDGLEATREIRRRGIATPVIALTASVLDETRNACEAAGMNGFIAKPIRVDEISSVLKQYHR